MDDESDESDLQNKDPAFIGAILSNVTEFLQLYGWFIVLALAAVYFLYSRIQPWLYRASQRREENSYKKLDVGVAQSRLEAMEKARQKMQAELDEQARVFAEQLKIKEEKKRQEKIEDWERHLQGKGYKSKTKAGIHLHSYVMNRLAGSQRQNYEYFINSHVLPLEKS
ncbi:selenoprotein S [Biomphalaria glabrata]